MISTSLGEKPLTVFSGDYFDSLLHSTLLSDTLLVEIPDNSKVYIMGNGDKLYLQTTQVDDMQMQDVEGVVIHKGKADVEIGDKVIFHYLSLNNGRDGFGGSRLFTFAYNNKLYLLIPCCQIFFSVRNGEYKSHNGKYLVCGIDNGAKIELDGKTMNGDITNSGIVIIDLKKQLYKKDRCKILCAPKESEYKVGDILVTNGTWDIPIKSDLMRGKEEKVYMCEKHNLICKEEFVEV